jgi:hypothetical protein
VTRTSTSNCRRFVGTWLPAAVAIASIAAAYARVALVTDAEALWSAPDLALAVLVRAKPTNGTGTATKGMDDCACPL